MKISRAEYDSLVREYEEDLDSLRDELKHESDPEQREGIQEEVDSVEDALMQLDAYEIIEE